MENKVGFILLPRNLRDHPLFRGEKATMFVGLVDLISLACYKPSVARFGDVVLKLNRGQLAYSMKHLGERWNTDRRRVKSFLKNFKKAELIDFCTTNKTTVITIKNYDLYQGSGHQNVQQNDINPDNTTITNNNKNNAYQKNNKIRKHNPLQKIKTENDACLDERENDSFRPNFKVLYADLAQRETINRLRENSGE